LSKISGIVREKKRKMEENQVDLSGRIVGEVEMPKLDIMPYVGKKTTIANVKYIEGEYNGRPTIYAKLESESLDILKMADGSGKELRATKLLSLMQLEGGKVGWTKNGNTAAYLKKMGVKLPDELKGKPITVVNVYNKTKAQDYLSWN
jgi:hypothetical protein